MTVFPNVWKMGFQIIRGTSNNNKTVCWGDARPLFRWRAGIEIKQGGLKGFYSFISSYIEK